VPAIDKIALDHRIFTALGAPGALSASAFVVGTTAHNSAEHILYDRATGTLTYDADGSGHGGAGEFAKLAAGLHLSASDFLVI